MKNLAERFEQIFTKQDNFSQFKFTVQINNFILKSNAWDWLDSYNYKVWVDYYVLDYGSGQCFCFKNKELAVEFELVNW